MEDITHTYTGDTTVCPFCKGVAGLFTLSDPKQYLEHHDPADLYITCSECPFDEIGIALCNQTAINDYDPRDAFIEV